jgi:hypothetical protein
MPESSRCHKPDDAVATRLGRVVGLLVAGDRRGARGEIESLAAVTAATHPIELLPTVPRLEWQPGTGALTAAPARAVTAAAYVRDGFACAYCARRTVPTQILRLVSVAFPEEFPYDPHWRRDVTARAYWDISTTMDHVHAVSRGGGRNDPTNLTTACARCQYQKNNLSLEALGWSIQRGSAGWTGLIEHYEPLWRQLGQPQANSHRPWIRTFAAAVADS